jgi:hypothetical protein
MQAATFSRFGTPDVLVVVDVPDRMPGSGEARVRVVAASVNPSDVKNVEGAMSQTTLPRIPGRDFSGVVDAGPDVWIGAEVWGSGNAGFTVDGSHAEHIIVPVAGLRRKPETLSFDEAAAGGVNYVAAQRGLVDAGGLRSGETVAIIGRAAASAAQSPKSPATWAQVRSSGRTGRPQIRLQRSPRQRMHSLPAYRTLPPPCVARSVAAALMWCSTRWAASCFGPRWSASHCRDG